MHPFKFIVFFVTTALSFLVNFSVKAQTPTIDSLLEKALISDELLPILIDSAVKYSAEFRKSGSSVTYARASLGVSKKAIFGGVSIGSSYNYGTNFSAVNNPSSTTAGNNFTTAQTGFYNIGLGVQLPVTAILNRKNIIKEGQSLLDAAIADQENTALLIKQKVIGMYQEFKLLKRMLVLNTKAMQSAQLNNTLAEKDFLNGQITVDQYSTVQDKLNKSIIDLETYINKFQTSYMQLEAFTGTNLSTLIRVVK